MICHRCGFFSFASFRIRLDFSSITPTYTLWTHLATDIGISSDLLSESPTKHGVVYIETCTSYYPRKFRARIPLCRLPVSRNWSPSATCDMRHAKRKTPPTFLFAQARLETCACQRTITEAQAPERSTACRYDCRLLSHHIH